MKFLLMFILVFSMFSGFADDTNCAAINGDMMTNEVPEETKTDNDAGEGTEQ
jgi:hypothetical protein